MLGCWVDETIVSLTNCLIFQVLFFFQNFLQNSLQKSFFFNLFITLQKNPSQQSPILFSIYQNDTWTIRCLVDETIDPATQRIILTEPPGSLR